FKIIRGLVEFESKGRGVTVEGGFAPSLFPLGPEGLPFQDGLAVVVGLLVLGVEVGSGLALGLGSGEGVGVRAGAGAGVEEGREGLGLGLVLRCGLILDLRLVLGLS